ncbi:MAG: hypothetical protein A3G34_16295 [Candidatus Lindowbacteria bacterium RIFCSPLOWO2_12_FULL_62_27]|nr:MAG: hypothetical protein A3I06_03630 [Candidatus Lindowbacteria bacterium RIFCSPLOWO2_02_FULL_62_12]OGH60484.1 MAG: hypothetical protein A3G34_16295 [Candidatus Lindowbacteria bacterium RIFCSPLOWO2_12_FULL_62_27]
MKKKDFYTEVDKVGDQDRATLVKIHGFLDEATAPEMDKQLVSMIDKGRIRFVFDCTEMKYIASSGIGVFIRLFGVVSEKDGDFVFIHVRPEIQRIFSMLGLEKLFKFRPSLQAALKEFS